MISAMSCSFWAISTHADCFIRIIKVLHELSLKFCMKLVWLIVLVGRWELNSMALGVVVVDGAKASL